MAHRAIAWLLSRPWLALLAALGLLLILFVLGQSDFAAADPLWYAAIAHKLATQPTAQVLNPGELHPFLMRVGLTVPLSLLYRAFDVSTVVTNLPCLFAELGIVGVVYAAAPTARAKWIGMLFCVTCVPLLRQGAVLNIDLPVAALLAFSVLCLSRRERARGRAWLVAGIIGWFAAFLVKETALWAVPIWLFAIALDLRRTGARATVQMYLPAIVAGLALLVGYLALSQHLWGSPLARFRGVQAITEEHAWSMHGKPARVWLDRMTWQVPLLLVGLYPVALAASVTSPWLVRGPERLWLVATAILLALYWFGTASLREYSPLPPIERMANLLLPGVLVLATLATDAALDRFSTSRARPYVLAALVVALVVPASKQWLKMFWRERPETAAYEVIRHEAALSTTPLTIVCGEPRCVPIGNFYFKFQIPPHVRFVSAVEYAKTGAAPGTRVWAEVNTARAKGARETHEDLTWAIDALGLPPIYYYRHIRLFEANDGARLQRGVQVPPR